MWEQNDVIPLLPMSLSNLDVEVKNVMKDSLQHYVERTDKFNFSKSYSEYRDGLVYFARGIFDSIQMRNTRIIVDFSNRVMEEVLKNLSRSLTRQLGDAMTLYELDMFATPAYNQAYYSFHLKTASLLKDHPSQVYILNTLKSDIDNAHVRLTEMNRNAVNVNIKQAASRISMTLVENLDDVKLPQSVANIGSQLRSLEVKMFEEYDELASKFANISSQYAQSRLYIIETFKSDSEELFKRNSFKLDRITKEILPSLNSMDHLVSYGGNIWYPSTTIAQVHRILKDEVMKSATSADSTTLLVDEDLIEDIVDRHMMKTGTVGNIYNKAMWSWLSLVGTLVGAIFTGCLSYYHCCK
jgi:hypothetical protein